MTVLSVLMQVSSLASGMRIFHFIIQIASNVGGIWHLVLHVEDG